MRGRGACMAGGHVCQGCVWQGAYMAEEACVLHTLSPDTMRYCQ